MAEAFQVAASAASIANFAFKLYQTLSAFVVKARDAQCSAKQLVDRAQRLRETLLMVRVTMSNRSRHFDDEQASEAEQYICNRINQGLKAFSRTLRLFRREIEKLNVGERESWLGKTVWQLRRDSADPKLTALQSDIAAFTAELSLSLQCMNLADVSGRQSSIEEKLRALDRKLEDCRHSVDAAISLDVSGTIGSSTSCNIHTQRAIHSIAAAEAARNSVVNGGEPTRELARLSRIITEREDEHSSPGTEALVDTGEDEEEEEIEETSEHGDPATTQADVVEADPATTQVDVVEADPDPSFDDTTPREPLEELIKSYQERVQQGRVVGDDDLEKVEEFQRRLIEHATEFNQAYEPTHDVERMWLDLSHILSARARLEEAHDILNTRFPSNPQGRVGLTSDALLQTESEPRTPTDAHTRLLQSDFYYALADLQLQQYEATQDSVFLHAATKWAKRCFRLRLDLRDAGIREFRESVCLFVLALKLQQLPVAVDVYTRLYLQDVAAPSPPTPPPTPVAEPPALAPARSVRSLSSNELAPEWFDINEPDGEGSTWLIRAVKRGDVEKVDLYHRHGADLEVRDKAGKNALIHAVENDEYPHLVVIKLLERGADVESTYKDLTALHYAIYLDKPTVVRLLLSKGAKIKSTVQAGETTSTEPGELGLKGKTTLIYAVMRMNASPTPEVRRSESSLEGHDAIISTLCERLQQEQKDAPDSDNLTALHHAVHTKRIEAVKTLLDQDVNPNVKDRQGKTPLHYAAERNLKNILKLILDASTTEINLTNNAGRTPLFVAARWNEFEIVELLLAHGAGFDSNASLDRRLRPPDMNRNTEKLLESTKTSRHGRSDSMSTASSSRSRRSLSWTNRSR
ncbi:hypothetical protein G647_02338 [Cladophialophora carrionii CBS 160.54]|uniref:Uncharacterized protein n=1 Tax=Cladophialophora carrionii CBS 160.54 TaxID=1279043 RepID=V9DF98_9EURO|nr:uncharacterized protein G647_02338 [Cladophialophora carrionii CBS 160.54]ETI25564.1 hypothetical protein G647_02338 [Cladophialophora carrionii CBS 160.54]